MGAGDDPEDRFLRPHPPARCRRLRRHASSPSTVALTLAVGMTWLPVIDGDTLEFQGLSVRSELHDAFSDLVEVRVRHPLAPARQPLSPAGPISSSWASVGGHVRLDEHLPDSCVSVNLLPQFQPRRMPHTTPFCVEGRQSGCFGLL